MAPDNHNLQFPLTLPHAKLLTKPYPNSNTLQFMYHGITSDYVTIQTNTFEGKNEHHGFSKSYGI